MFAALQAAKESECAAARQSASPTLVIHDELSLACEGGCYVRSTVRQPST
jgi:hypothetical protein